MNDEFGNLKIGEPHPTAHDAYKYVKEQIILKGFILRESFASCALSGNRMAEICLETLRRMMEGEPVSDRYILGLAWFLKYMEESKQETKPKRKKKSNS